MATGQAAGILAAVAARKGARVQAVPATTVIAKLKETGALCSC
jgi:hypothetical protein